MGSNNGQSAGGVKEYFDRGHVPALIPISAVSVLSPVIEAVRNPCGCRVAMKRKVKEVF